MKRSRATSTATNIRNYLGYYFDMVDRLLTFFYPKHVEIDYNDPMFILFRWMFFFCQSVLHSLIPIFIVQLFTNLFGETIIGNYTDNIVICSITYTLTRIICEFVFFKFTWTPDEGNVWFKGIFVLSICCSIMNMIVKNESRISIFIIPLLFMGFYCIPLIVANKTLRK